MSGNVNTLYFVLFIESIQNEVSAGFFTRNTWKYFISPDYNLRVNFDPFNERFFSKNYKLLL